MIEYLNILFCIGALAAAFAAIVQVAASDRAFPNMLYRVLALLALGLWMIHGVASALSILEGNYASSLWSAAHWFANLAISVVIVKLLARFESFEMDAPVRSALFKAAAKAAE